MASDPIPSRDTQFKLWGTNFATVAGANAAALGLSIPDTAAITAASTNFSTDMTSAETARTNAKGAVAAKRTTRRNSEATFRRYAKQILANPTISPLLKGQLGLNPNPTPLGPVVSPADLSATGYGNGTNSLKWKRNGNAASTVFILEARIGTATTFSVVQVTSKTRFDHEGQTPGVQVIYRVSATRGGVQSAPSNEAVVYSTGSGTGFLSVAA